jgi:tetratricopeptide (TPR) repeat protein
MRVFYTMSALLMAGAAAAAAAEALQGYDRNERGVRAFENGDYTAAERFLREALDQWRALGPRFEPHYAATLANLADALCGEGRWREAAGNYREALEIDRRGLGAFHERTIAALDGLANAVWQTGDAAGAEPLFREALALEREHHPGSIQLSHTLIGLAILKERTGDFDAALPLAEEALRIAVDSAHGDNHETALADAELANIHRRAGRPELAEPLLRKALAIYERTLGPDHPYTAALRGEQGLAFLEAGKLALAERDITASMAVLARHPGCTYELAIAKNNLGLLRFRQKKYEQAARLLTEALALEEAASPSSGLAAKTLSILADVREQQHRQSEAAQLRRRALTMQSYR